MNIHIFSTILLMFYIIFMIFTFLFNITYTRLQFIAINVIFILILGVFSYTFLPPDHFDLYRYFQWMAPLKSVSWKEARVIGPYPETQTINFLMYFVSQTGNNHLLSPIVTITIFSIVLFVSQKYIYINKKGSKSYSYGLYFYLVISALGIYFLVSGLRQNLAWSFMILAIYYDIFDKGKYKFVKIVLYLFPVTIHISAIIIPILRIFSVFINLKPKGIYLVLLWPIFIQILNEFYEKLPTIIQAAVMKLGIYGEMDVKIMDALVYVPLYLIFIYIATYLYINKDISIKQNYLLFYLTVLLFGLSSIKTPLLSSRILDLCVLISLPLIVEVFELPPLRKTFIVWTLFISGSIIFLYQDIYPFILSLA